VSRATGATIVNSVFAATASDIGTQCGLFEISKIGDEYFTFLTKCKDPKACTILLRGPSKDILNEVERNLHDAMGVARNVIWNPKLCPGGGATEMAIAVGLDRRGKLIEGVAQWPYKAVAEAMEVIPRTIIQNSGNSPIKVLTQLRAKHAEGYEPIAVKEQSIKTAIESACLLLRVDDIVAAKSAKQVSGPIGGGGDD
jgi:T-complex protein 1 subunit gamma